MTSEICDSIAYAAYNLLLAAQLYPEGDAGKKPPLHPRVSKKIPVQHQPIVIEPVVVILCGEVKDQMLDHRHRRGIADDPMYDIARPRFAQHRPDVEFVDHRPLSTFLCALYAPNGAN